MWNIIRIGDIISRNYFDLKNLNESEREKFEQRYNSWEGKAYVFREQLHYYCEMVVNILRKCAAKLSSMMYGLVGMRPFYDKTCMTIASLALKIFCTKFMKKNTVGVIPALGYQNRVNQSLIALI